MRIGQSGMLPAARLTLLKLPKVLAAARPLLAYAAANLGWGFGNSGVDADEPLIEKVASGRLFCRTFCL